VLRQQARAILITILFSIMAVFLPAKGRKL
jgi:hypothetical protein